MAYQTSQYEAPALLGMVRKAPKPAVPPLWTTKDLAVRLDVHPDTPRRWRKEGGDAGPPFIKLPKGGVRYDADAVEAWLAKRRRKSTSQD